MSKKVFTVLPVLSCVFTIYVSEVFIFVSDLFLRGKNELKYPKPKGSRAKYALSFLLCCFSPLIGFHSALRCEPFLLHFLFAHLHELGKKLSTTFGCF